MEENTVVSAAESTEAAESQSNDFLDGFAEEFGAETGETEGEATEETETGEPETPPEEESKAAESGAEDEKAPEMLSFKEHGKDFSVPKEAVEAFAKGVGRDASNIIDIYQKGCNYDSLLRKFDEAKRDSELLENLAGIRNISKEQARNEILGMLERIPIDKMTREILTENPGMRKETAEELAKLRFEQQKPKADAPKNAETNTDEDEARIREIDMFVARHSGEGIEKLPNEVIDVWKKTGISLEDAYRNFQNREKVAELEREIAELKKKNTKEEQKAYAKEHSAGSSGSTTSGKDVSDPFLEAFRIDY